MNERKGKYYECDPEANAYRRRDDALPVRLSDLFTPRLKLVTYPFPMRGDVARLDLPANLTVREAERLVAFIRTLPLNAEAGVADA